jgi:hypothetical protein
MIVESSTTHSNFNGTISTKFHTQILLASVQSHCKRRTIGLFEIVSDNPTFREVDWHAYGRVKSKCRWRR